MSECELDRGPLERSGLHRGLGDLDSSLRLALDKNCSYRECELKQSCERI